MKYVLGNWKMHTTPAQGVELAGRIDDGLEDLAHAKELPTVILAPPFTALTAVQDVLDSTRVHMAAQDCHWADEGPYTGEISAPMLKGLAEYVILGHPDRRRMGEKDETIARKVGAAARAGLTPILCVGEADEQEDAADTATDQLRAAFEEVNVQMLKNVLVAYEPIYAQGAEQPVVKDLIEEVTEALRETATEIGLSDAAILYGGAVGVQTIGDLKNLDIDGLVVGRASLDPTDFVHIVSEIVH